MPTVLFITHVPDPGAEAARWLRHERPAGARVRVLGPAPLLQALSQALWVQDREDFIPHWLAAAPGAPPPGEPGLERTPLWLGPGAIAGPEPAWVLNLGPGMPEDPQQRTGIVEIVSLAPDDRQAGRERWAAYRAMGMATVHRSLQPDA